MRQDEIEFGYPANLSLGRFTGLTLPSRVESLHDMVPEGILLGEERDNFVSFIRQTMAWDPEERPSAKELSEHRWLTYWTTDEDIEAGRCVPEP